MPSGAVLSEDAAECEEILEFARGPVVAQWPSFQDWLDEVPLQRTALMMDIVFAVVESGWDAYSFPATPAEVPCGSGVTVSEQEWQAGPLGAAGIDPPERLYVSVSLEILGEQGDGGLHIDVRAHQDFDCDGMVAESNLEGIARQGWLVFKGGWTPLSGDHAQVHE